MKNYLLLILLLVCSCRNSTHQQTETNEKDVVETKEPGFSDIIDVVSVETGWYEEQAPQIKIKFKNVSDKPIDSSMMIKYQFVEDDEVMDEGYKYIHSASKVPWDNGIIKTETLRSSFGYLFGGHRHKVYAKICSEDNTIIWEGNIAQEVIY